MVDAFIVLQVCFCFMSLEGRYFEIIECALSKAAESDVELLWEVCDLSFSWVGAWAACGFFSAKLIDGVGSRVCDVCLEALAVFGAVYGSEDGNVLVLVDVFADDESDEFDYDPWVLDLL